MLQGLSVILCLATTGGQVSWPIVTPLHPSGIYRLHEPAGWNIALLPGAPTPAGTYHYELKANNFELLKSGDIDLSKGQTTIYAELTKPAMLYLSLQRPGGGQPMAYGAAVDPTDLKPVVPRPSDFKQFWARKIAELESIPENPVLTEKASGQDGVDYATIQMDHVGGGHITGQIAKPSRPGKYPAMLMLQWASPPYPLQKNWITGYAAQGWLVLDIEPHDVLPDAAPDYYRNLPQELKNYTAIGQDDREKSYFVKMVQADYRAADYLTHRPDWNGKTLLVMGTSMGGQQSLCVAGLHPKITDLIVEVPSGCDLNASLHGRQLGYPNFPDNDSKAMETARYVDAVNFAPDIKATCLVGMGFIDTVAPPAGIWTAFNEIKGPKEVAPMPLAPHNNLATQEQQLPYSTRANAWLKALVVGSKPPIVTGVSR